MYLEGRDPKLLDKETHKVYHRVAATGCRVEGPIPLPVRIGHAAEEGPSTRIHRRLFRFLSPTERTVSLLEKLSLSGSVTTSLSAWRSRRSAKAPMTHSSSGCGERISALGAPVGSAGRGAGGVSRDD